MIRSREKAKSATRQSARPDSVGEGLPAIAVRDGWERLMDGPARRALEETVLPAFVQAQRWFGGKARRVESVRITDWGELRGAVGLAWLVLLEIRFVGGTADLYALPLGITAGDRLLDALKPWALALLDGPAGRAILHDALAEDENCIALLDAIGAGRSFETREGKVRAVATRAFASLRGPAGQPLPVKRGPATSSNTLVFFGERLLLKLFRRLEEGINPDFEIGRFLTEASPFERMPKVAGMVEYERPGREPYTLAILQQLVPNQADGWRHALDELARYFDRAAAKTDCVAVENDERPLPELARSEPPAQAREAIGTYLQAASTLGRRTAEMHRALAAGEQDPAFAPERLTPADLTALREDILAQARSALTALRENVGRLSGEVAAQGRQLLGDGPGWLERLKREPTTAAAGQKIRVHGDYHLGQVLWADNDFVILDFEGEPTRTVDERRAKQSPLKDVAGMLRSFHYAAYAGLFAFAKDRTGDFGRLEPWADLWHRWVSAAFLRAYREAARGAAFLPARPEEFAALLDAFMLAKAFYELVYELNNRPDWVRIPLRGILALLEQDKPTDGSDRRGD